MALLTPGACAVSVQWGLDLHAHAVTSPTVCCSYNINDEGTPGEGFAIVTATPCNITVGISAVCVGAQFVVAGRLYSFSIVAQQHL